MRLVRHFQGLKTFWLGVLSEVRQYDEEVELVKCFTDIMRMLRFNFGKLKVSKMFHASLSIN